MIPKRKAFAFIKITLLTIFIILLLGIITIAGTAFYLYKNQKIVADMVLKELNDMQVGHTTLQNVYVNPYKNFPYISIDLNKLAFYASKQAQTPIYIFEDVYLGFNLWSIIEGDYTIKRIVLKDGKINLVKNEKGEYNLLLAKSFKQKSQEKGGKIHVDLQKISLENIVITKKDLLSKQDLKLHFETLNTSFSYKDQTIKNIVETRLTLQHLRIDTLTLFSNKHLYLNTNISYDLQKNLIAIAPSQFHIEGGEFNLKGSVDLNKDAYVDLLVQGSKPDFKLITAFAPAYIYERLQRYKNKGNIYFIGKIKGKALNDTPQIDLEFGCKNAQFINPSEKNSIRDLNFSGFFTNGIKRNLSTCELMIKSLSGKPEESIFKGSFHIKNFQNPFVSVDFHSKIDLSTLKNFFEIESLKTLKGWLIVDMTIDELLDYNDVPATLGKLKDGTDSRIVLKDVNFQPDGVSLPIRNLQAQLTIKDGKLLLNPLKVQIKDTDLHLEGEISNLSSYWHTQDTAVYFKLKGASQKMDLKQLAGIEEKVQNLSFETAFNTRMSYIKQPTAIPQGEFLIQNLNFKLRNYPHAFHDTHADFIIDGNSIAIKQLETVIDNSDIHFLGKINNYKALLDTAYYKQKVDAQLQLTANELKFDELFLYNNTNYMPKDYQHEVMKGLHLDMAMQLAGEDLRKGDLLHYTKLNINRFDAQMKLHPLAFREVEGQLTFQNKGLNIQKFHAKMGTSDFNLNAQIDNLADIANRKSKKMLHFAALNLNLDELLTLPQEPAAIDTLSNTPPDHDSRFNIFGLPFPEMQIKVEMQRFQYKKYLLKDFVGVLRTTPKHYIYIDQLQMKTAGGECQMNGYFNGENKDKIYLKSTIKVKDLDLDKFFYKFDNFGQDYLVSKNLHGKITGTIESDVRMHTDFTPNLQETTAHIEATITEGSIVNFAAFKAMSAFFVDKDLDNVRFAEMTNTFDYKNGIVSFPKMEVATTLGYIFVEGKQNIDTSMDYDVQIPLKLIKKATWDYLFRRKKERKKNPEDRADDEVVDEIISSKDTNYKLFVTLNIKGTPANYKIKLGKSKDRKPSKK